MNEFLGYVKIKNRAIVGQDMGCHEWKDNGEIFEAFSFNKEKYKLTANGYGSFKPGERYGNGAIFPKECDVEFVEMSGADYKEHQRNLINTATDVVGVNPCHACLTPGGNFICNVSCQHFPPRC